MKAMGKTSGRAASEPAGMAAGAAMSAVITGVGTVLISYFLDHEYLLWENVGYAVMVMILLSSYGGARIAYGKIRRQRFLVCLASGGIYWGLLLMITALLFGGKYEAVGVTLLLVLGGSMCAALPGRGEGRRTPVHGKRKRRG